MNALKNHKWRSDEISFYCVLPQTFYLHLKIVSPQLPMVTVIIKMIFSEGLTNPRNTHKHLFSINT